VWPSASKAPKSRSPCGSFALQKSSNTAIVLWCSEHHNDPNPRHGVRPCPRLRATLPQIQERSRCASTRFTISPNAE
jgi:hypothetical protein